MWQDLKDAISLVFTSNNNNEITGQDAREAINNLVIPSLGQLQYKGVALPYVDAQNTGTDPGTPSGAAFYLASEPGEYPNFNGYEIAAQIVAFVYDHTADEWVTDIIANIGAGGGGVSQVYVDGEIDKVNARIDTLIGGGGTAPNSWQKFSLGYQGNLDFQPYAEWNFGGNSWSKTSAVLTATADPTNDRIALVVLNDQGQIILKQGTPAANPQEPSIDPETELAPTGGFIYIPAGATSLPDVSLNKIYTENQGTAGDEFDVTIAQGTGRWLLDDTTDPHAGTYAIKGDTLQQGDRLVFNPAAPIDPAQFTELSFYIKNLTLPPAERGLYIYLSGESSSIRGRRTVQYYLPALNTVGYDPANTTDWQFISIPVPALSLVSVEAVVMFFNDSGNFSVLLDDIKYNDGTAPTGEEFATIGWVQGYAQPKLPAAPGTEKALVIAPDGTLSWTGEKLTAAEKAKIAAALQLSDLDNVVLVNTSRNLAASDIGKILYVTAAVTLTWPSGGIVGFKANLECNSTGAATIADQAGTPGDDLSAPNGVEIAADKSAYLFIEPVGSKLRISQ